jgi:Family of unknown function (DUF6232)
MTEQLLFQADDIRITSTIAQFGGTTYQIALIGSVGVTRVRTRRPITVAIFLFGALVLAAALLGRYFEITDTDTTARSGQLIMTGIVIMLGAGLLQLVWPGRRYILIFRTASGDIQAFRTRKRDLAAKVKQAIEQAFIARRAQG